MAGSGSSGSAASVPAAEWSTIYEMTTWLKENQKILYVNGCFTDTTVEQTHYSKFCSFCLSRAAFSAQLPLSIVHQGIGQTKRHTRGPPCRGKPVIFPYGTFRDGAGTAACIGRTGEEVLERVYCNFPQGRMSRNGPNPPFGREGGGVQNRRASRPFPCAPAKVRSLKSGRALSSAAGTVFMLFCDLDAFGDSGNPGDRPVRNGVVRSGRGYALGVEEGLR